MSGPWFKICQKVLGVYLTIWKQILTRKLKKLTTSETLVIKKHDCIWTSKFGQEPSSI